MATDVARHLTVRGRVQGVFFRVRTYEQAQAHGVGGWVANRPDGSVEAWLEGPADAVAAVEAWIRDGGPSRARVDEVTATDATPAGHDHFDVRD